MTQTHIGQALIDQSKFRLREEFVPRILKCLDQLSDEEIWHRPNPHTVGVGNLVIHLCGNLRQWVISGLGGAPDHRDRDSEFIERGDIPRDHLVKRLENTVNEVCEVLDNLDPDTLLDARRVQGFDETGISILVHVVEHFSYHTGQITLHVKTRKAIDLGYYEGQDLNATS